MPRVKLAPQDRYQHTYHTTVRVGDLNYGGHLGNDSLLGLIHEARVRFLCDMGFSETNLGDGKTGVIMSDVVVNYRGEGLLFDELQIESSFAEIQNTVFRMLHRLSTPSKLIALAEIGLAAYDYEKEKLSRLPEEFHRRLAALLK